MDTKFHWKTSLTALAEHIHDNAKRKGFWHEKRPVPTLLMLIVSEAAEALEGDRLDIPEGEKGCLSEELADIIIRVLDMSQGYNLDIANAIDKKLHENSLRPHMHGKRY